MCKSGIHSQRELGGKAWSSEQTCKPMDVTQLRLHATIKQRERAPSRGKVVKKSQALGELPAFQWWEEEEEGGDGGRDGGHFGEEAAAPQTPMGDAVQGKHSPQTECCRI